MRERRALVVVADDFGMGPATSAGSLELARRGLITGTVMMVNSPHAEAGVRAWRRAGCPVELGWHPSLTSDGPVLPPSRVPSLVGPDERFWSLGRFVQRLLLGQIDAKDVCAEFQAQYERFCDLVGHPPTFVNAHQHVALFEPVGSILMNVLGRERPLSYLRRVREPWQMLFNIRGARCKRTLLSILGRPLARQQQILGFPGNDWLAGITDPHWVKDPQFLVRWLKRIPGKVVELACHPGYYDHTLIGRDCTAHDGRLQRRADEFALLSHSGFTEACHAAGFERVAPSELIRYQAARRTHAVV